MSNLIPPLLSSSPPPIITNDDEDEDEFGDFTSAVDLACNGHSLSPPGTPVKIAAKTPFDEGWENVNSISCEKINTDILAEKVVEKDFQDKRKCETMLVNSIELSTNLTNVDNLEEGCERLNTDIPLEESRSRDTFKCTTAIIDVPNHKDITEIAPEDSNTTKNVVNNFDTSDLCLKQDEQTIPIEVELEPIEFNGFQITNQNEKLNNSCEYNTITNLESISDAFATDEEVAVINSIDESMGNKESISKTEEKMGVIEINHDTVINENLDINLHFEEPPEIPPDLEIDDDFGDFESKSVEVDSESDSQVMPSESLVPFDENKDGFNYIGIIRSVRDETILLNAAPDAIKIDGHDSNLEIDPVCKDNAIISDDNLTKNQSCSDFSEFKMENGSNLTPNDNFANFKISSDTETNDFEFKNAFNGMKSENIPFVDEKKSDLSSIPNVSKPNEIKSLNNKDNTFNNKDATEVISNDNDDTFGDFSTFESEVVTNSPDFQPKLDVITDSQPTFSEDDDDFGDFDDYSSNSMGNNTFGDFSNGQKESINLPDIMTDPKQAEKIISEMFPIITDKQDDFKVYDFVENDQIFKGLKDITETIALSYQWPKSSSQEIFLKALNIDMRNILHGPGWNPNMPRFASNLGLTPLEPVKSEILTPTPVLSSLSTTQSLPTVPQASANTSSDIPNVNFDWTTSGLTNPLDYSNASMMLLDLEHLVASLDVSSTHSPNSSSRNSYSPSKEYDEWENWLNSLPKDTQDKTSISSDPLTLLKLDENNDFSTNNIPTKQFDTESVNSLQLTELPPDYEPNEDKKATNVDNFDDFTSYQAPTDKEDYLSMNWSCDNMVPLRETYITAEKKDKKDDKTNSVEPSILEESTNKIDSNEIDDEFTDFQMVLPSTQSKNVEDKVEKQILPTQSKIVDNPQPILNTFENLSTQNIIHNVPQVILEPLKPVPASEPLKPNVVSSAVSNSINWPDPGDINEMEILNAFNYRKQDIVKIESPKKPELKDTSNNDIQKVQTNAIKVEEDDDDWTEFVSNKDVAPQNKQSKTKPELQLSIGQLSQVKPPKKSIPIITPHGLVQTKLPTSIPNIRPDNSINLLQKPNDGYQPAIISNQFNAQVSGYLDQSKITHNNFHVSPAVNHKKGTVLMPNTSQQVNTQNNSMWSQGYSNFVSNNHEPMFTVQGKNNFTPSFPSFTPQTVENHNNDDDDWSDFVSGQLPSANVAAFNGSTSSVKPLESWNGPPQFTSWNSPSFATNIITNPSHFESSFSDVNNVGGPRSSAHVAVPSKKSTVPSISALPDLEFIAPKSRCAKK